MLNTGILNPSINSLLSRVRHTNTIVIADRGFPYWPAIETVDISLVDDMPKVLDVVRAILLNFSPGAVFMAEEFRSANPTEVRNAFSQTFEPLTIAYEPHKQFKSRIPNAIGLIRTADTTQYANVIIESA